MHHHFAPWLAFAALCLALGCGGPQTYQVVGTERDPGADGTIQVEQIEGGNHLITVSFSHMTPPERLGQNLRRFIVWFRNPQGQDRMASRLAYDPASRTGRATATTPLNRFVVIVTAEAGGSTAPAEPSGHVIFSQRVTAQ